MLNRLVDTLASVKLAVVLMAVLAIVCGTATIHESRNGTAAAQRDVYATPWFAGLLVLLAANVFLSMVRRWPWTLHHTGFVAAHLGILYVLAGSLVSVHLGAEGTLALQEGESSDRVALGGTALRVAEPGRAPVSVALDGAGDRDVPGTGLTLSIVDSHAHVGVEERIAPAEHGSPALLLHLQGAGFGRHDLTLLADHPGRSHAEFGPVHFVLETSESASAAASAVGSVSGRAQATFAVDPAGVVHYGLASRKGATVVGTAAKGVEIATPWMDIALVLDDVVPKAAVQRTVVPQDPPAREDRRQPAVRVQMAGAGAVSDPRWIAFGEREVLTAGGRSAEVSFTDAEMALPFQVALLDFHSERYPGSNMPATYESRVRIVDPARGTSEHHIAMNKPLKYDGYTFFQASYAEGPRMTSVFQVSRAPGLPLVYLGTLLMTLGTAWMFYLKPWLARRAGLRALAARASAPGRGVAVPAVVALAALALAAPGEAAPGDPLESLRLVAVQDGGRVKPLDTYAREAARRVTGARAFGAESVAGLDPVAWLVSMAASPERWRSEPIVRVTSAESRRLAALPAEKDRYSFQDLVGHEAFLAAAESLRGRLQADPDAALEAGERDLLQVYDRLSLMAALFSGEEPRVLPDVTGAPWTALAASHDGHDHAPDEGHGTAAPPEVQSAHAALLDAQRGGDAARLRSAAEALQVALSRVAPAQQPAQGDLAREVHLNRLKPFRWAWLLYLVALLALAASVPLGSRVLGTGGLAAAALGLALHTYGLTLRTLVAGRAPVTNMYETVVFAAWGAVAMALLFELRQRVQVFAASASFVAVVFLLVADTAPIMDSAIDPLVPVLRDNFWLTSHVLTIMLGYAAYFVGVVIAHLVLWLVLFSSARAALRARLSSFLYRTTQVGTLFLAAGTLLGGVWASYSWGRFWGWDPKETWSLIALLVYLAVIHARFAGWVKDLGLAIGSLLGGLTVVMAWYGVNFILGTGLHSYGFGSGGVGWVLGYAVFEVAVIVAAALKSGVLKPPAAEPVSAPGGHPVAP